MPGRGNKGPQSAGSGLGLYLVDRIVELYGGTVSIGEGHLGGAAVVVELRRA